MHKTKKFQNTKLETDLDEKINDTNTNVAEWKKNVNGVIEGVKTEQDQLNREVIRTLMILLPRLILIELYFEATGT